MKKQKGFFEPGEKPIGDLFWSNIPNEIISGSTRKVNEDVYDISTNLEDFLLIQLIND